MPGKKRITDLSRKSLKSSRAGAVKGGRKQQFVRARATSALKDKIATNHNQTLRTRV
jgi:hypothetical protein